MLQYNLGPFPPSIALKHLTYLPSILLCLEEVFFNKQSAYLWVLTLLLLSLTCPFIRMRQTSYKEHLKKNDKKLVRSFNFMFRYIDDVFSPNNSRFGDFVDSSYPIELEIKDTTNTDRSPSYLDLHLDIDSGWRIRTKLSDKRDNFNFPIVNLPYMCSNISSAPAYGIYISHLIRYSRACGSCQDFLDKGLLHTRNLLNQRFLLVKLKSSASMTWLIAMEYLCHK